MSNLSATPSWDDIWQWDTVTQLIGGDGAAPMNKQAQSLLNRTQWLFSKAIFADTTLNVPAQYATIQAAMDHLAPLRIMAGVNVVIQVAHGTIVPTASCLLNHPDGDRISLIGDPSSKTSCIVRPAGIPTFDLFVVSSGYKFGKIAGFYFDLAAKAVQANNATAVLSYGAGSYVNVEDCQSNNWYYSFAARTGACMRALRCESDNAGDVGFWAFTGSVLQADTCTASGTSDPTHGLGFGFQGEFGGVVEAVNCTATGCYEAGFAALSNGVGRYYSCLSAGNSGGTGAGFMAKLGGKIEGDGSTSTSNTLKIYVSEDSGIYNGPADGGGNGAASNSFAFLDAIGGQGRVASSSGPMRVDTSDASSVYFNSSGGLQAEVRHAATATSRVFLQGGNSGTANQPIFGVDGTAADIAARYQSKGAGSHYFRTGAGTMFEVSSTTGGTEWLSLTAGSGEGHITPAGSNAVRHIRLTPIGTGGSLKVDNIASAANDTAAAAAGVPINGIYRNGGALQVRLT